MVESAERKEGRKQAGGRKEGRMKEATGNDQPVERNGRFTFDSFAGTGSEFQGPYDAHPHQPSRSFHGRRRLA